MTFVPILFLRKQEYKIEDPRFVKQIGTVIKKHMSFAIIKTGGKQYKVAEGDTLSVEKLEHESDKVVFDQVLLWANSRDVKVGKPLVSGAKVEAKVLEDGKGKKKMVFRYKSKTRRRKKKGHRQPYTKIQIVKILS